MRLAGGRPLGENQRDRSFDHGRPEDVVLQRGEDLRVEQLHAAD
jgi:hypothetical protein